MPVDYSRFDHIGSESEEEPNPSTPVQAVLSTDEEGSPSPPRPPQGVMEDLEDYFERLDARRAEALEQGEEPPSVERFTEEDLGRLKRLKAAAGCQAECAICIQGIEAADDCLQLPCAAQHTFHDECVRAWLSRNVTCPLCRVDVRQLVRALPGSSRREDRSGMRGQPSPRAFGFTRDGGVIARYEPRPPPELLRPAYIPPQLHAVAELVEITYPERGTARVWRVPR